MKETEALGFIQRCFVHLFSDMTRCLIPDGLLRRSKESWSCVAADSVVAFQR